MNTFVLFFILYFIHLFISFLFLFLIPECIELTKEREVLETRTDGDQDQILTEDENLSVQVTNNEITIKENGEITYDVHPSTPPESAENVENAVVNGASNSNGSGSVQNNNGGEDDGTEISELTPEEQVEKLRMEKTFRKQEEVWLRKREKVGILKTVCVCV